MIKKEFLIRITIITHYEILSGSKFKYSKKSIEAFSELYDSLTKKGNPLGDIDLLIAGIAIENEHILVTENISHFKRIKGLKIENWNQ